MKELITMLRKDMNGGKMPSDTEDLRAAFLAFLADGPAPERTPFYAADPDRAYPQRVPAEGHCRDEAWTWRDRKEA